MVFGEEAMRSYVQTLHGLIEGLNEKSKNCENIKPQDNLRIHENMKKVEKYETRKCTNSLAENGPRIQDTNIEKIIGSYRIIIQSIVFNGGIIIIII